MKKIALIGGVVAVAVICAVMFLGGGGSVSIGKKTESPFIAKAAVPSAELQKAIKDKQGYKLDEAFMQYTNENPNDATAWLLYGDTLKAVFNEYEPFGLRHLAASAYWKGMQLGDPECRKRLLWMISPASIRSEGYIVEYDADKRCVFGEMHPNYRYEMERLSNALRDIDTSTPDGQKQAEEIRDWATVVSIISLEDGDVKCAPLFYDLLLAGEPTDEDYLMAAYVTIFTDYLISQPDTGNQINILDIYEIDQNLFSLDLPKVKEIVDREIKNQSPVGITMAVMLSRPKCATIEDIRWGLANEMYNRKQPSNKNMKLDDTTYYWDTNEVDNWLKSAPERVKKLESVYDQLDTIGMFVLGNEYLNLNMDENYNFTGKYSQKAIDCFKACQKDPYAINLLSTATINYSIVSLPDTEISKIAESIGKKGHGKEYKNPEKSWKTVFEKMENVEWKDITVPRYYRDNIWCRTILCSGTYQGDNISIIFPVFYNTQSEMWVLFDGWTKVLINKDYNDVLPIYTYIQRNPQEVLLIGLEGYNFKNPPQPSREVAPWMSEILD